MSETTSFPGLGFDPAPGLPSGISDMVEKVADARDVLEQTSTTLRSIADASGFWQGAAADSFSGQLGELPEVLDDARTSMEAATRELENWQSALTGFQALARQYEAEAVEARSRLARAEANPDLNLAGQHFDTDAALADAQERLNRASAEVESARGELDSVLARARQLQGEHGDLAVRTAANIRAASENAPAEPGFFDRFMNLLGEAVEAARRGIDAVWNWIQANADLIYDIGDWIGIASGICDILTVILAPTGIGALAAASIGAGLNILALGLHGLGYAAGAEDRSLVDIGFDVVGFVPFGDLARVGRFAWESFSTATIPTNFLRGADALNAAERAADIAAQVGGSARAIENEVKQRWEIVTDNFSDRVRAAALRMGDRFVNNPLGGSGFALAPIVERIDPARVPGIAGAVQERVGTIFGRDVSVKFIDPGHWVSDAVRVGGGLGKIYNGFTSGFDGIAESFTDSIQGQIDQVGEMADWIGDRFTGEEGR
ncbi:putative T7SS-secreted protein [Allostreptomyces psammosilenae]|uniref:Uncharacterized protein YukE n=1 Tax=Allostreptomyces psammosilenae TaxID=1892865 RepID=A0A852ZVW1_9ACTN|nr:hypothetical protein [Allostreptomyces psammosilenae]NYI06516.1 uncharacterized protein YukE [Allostreptomyces psammosilenae]